MLLFRHILVFLSVLHRMMLIGCTHLSQFMECQNLGITALNHARCAPNVFKKLMGNQITADFIYLKFTLNFLKFCDQVNSWKNLLKLWNGPLCRKKSGPLPLLNVALYCKSSNNKACPKKLSQILPNKIHHGRKGIGLRIYVRCCGL